MPHDKLGQQVGIISLVAQKVQEAQQIQKSVDSVKAVLLWLDLLPFIEKSIGVNNLYFATSLNELAGVYLASANYDEAEVYYKRSLVIWEQVPGPDSSGLTISIINLGTLYEATSRYSEAEVYFRRALAICEHGSDPNHLNYAACQNGLALVYVATGCYPEAEDCFQKSLAVRVKNLGLDNPVTAICQNGLAWVFMETERYDEAECYFRMALANCKQEPHYTAAILNNLAALFKVTGHYEDAEDCLLNSLENCKGALHPNHPDIATCLNVLADLYVMTHRYNEAKSIYQQSLAVCARGLILDHPIAATSLNGLSSVYKEAGHLNAAILLSKRSVNIMQNVRRNVSGMGKEVLSTFDNSIASYYENLAEILIIAERYGEAEYVMGMLKEKELFEMQCRSRQEDLPTRILSYTDAEAPLVAHFSEIGSSLSGAGRLLEALKQIKDRTLEQNQALADVKGQLENHNRVFSEFLDALIDTLPDEKLKQVRIDTHSLFNLTEANLNTVAVSTITAENGFHTIMVTPHGRKAFSADHKAVDIATKVLKFREIIQDPADPTYLALSKELYNIIIRPIEEELISGDYTTILWMLNGVLRILPLASLHDGKQFMLEKYRNVCITTCSTINQQSHGLWNGLGMGVTLKHGDHEPLPAVKEELEGIISIDNSSGIIPGDILLDKAFTRDAMESHLDAGYKVVHIASHFELNPINESMSYLLLGDGSKIRMDELSSNPRLFKGVDLVTFSACSTGLGTASAKGREVDGIGYLGEMQGAKTVLATLWPVEDKSTSMLMREFYRLCETGLTKAESLRQAQLRLLNGEFTSDVGYDFTHPYFWAPFILIGNGG